jgi:hypothetical protein
MRTLVVVIFGIVFNLCTRTDKPACRPLKNGIKGKPYFAFW